MYHLTLNNQVLMSAQDWQHLTERAIVEFSVDLGQDEFLFDQHKFVIGGVTYGITTD